MSKYEKLDAAILRAIADGKREFVQLHAGDVLEEAKRIAAAESDGKPSWKSVPSYRVTDRRLQALRRSGKIRFARGSRGGWTLC